MGAPEWLFVGAMVVSVTLIGAAVAILVGAFQ